MGLGIGVLRAVFGGVLGVAFVCVPAMGQGTLVVLNKAEATASIIDLTSGVELGRVGTGDGPHEVAVSPDGRTAVVADYGGELAGSTLSVIDLETRTRTATIELGKYSRPHGIVFLRGGRGVLVTSEATGRLVTVDIGRGEVVGSLRTMAQGSHMVAMSADGGFAYVANIESGSCSVFDLHQEEFVTRVRTGDGAEGIAVRPDGREVWVTNRAGDTVSVIDTETLRVKQTIACGSFPIRVGFTPDGSRALVSCARSGEVAVFDTQTKKQIKRIKMDLRAMDPEGRLFGDRFGGSSVPIGIMIPAEGGRAYIANTQADVIAVIDLESLEVVGSIVAGKEPDGMAWSPLEFGEDEVEGTG